MQRNFPAWLLIKADTGLTVHDEVARVASDLMFGSKADTISFWLDKINPGGVVMVIDGIPTYCIFPYKYYYGFDDHTITGVYTDYSHASYG